MNILGTEVEVLVPSDATASGHFVFEITIPAGGEIPPHIHVDEDEVIHLVEGALEITYGKLRELRRYIYLELYESFVVGE